MAAQPQLAAVTDPPPTCTVSMVVKLGTRGDPATCLETRLVQLGYTLAGPDGNFDFTGVTALKAFQSSRGLPVTGIAYQSTLEALQLWRAPQPLPPATCHTSITVTFGTRGDPARCVKSRLIQLGYTVSGAADNFESTALAGLRAFQWKYGLLNDGFARQSTLQALGVWTNPPLVPAATCRTSWQVTPGSWGYPARCVETRLIQLGYDLVGPDSTFDSTAVSALKRYQASQGFASTGIADLQSLIRLQVFVPLNWPASTCKTHYAVSYGTTGSGARCVETRLAQLGYFTGTPDSFFSGSAAEALHLFQYRNGLAADEVAGRWTLYRLGIYDPNPPPAAALPENSGHGRRIVYSRAQQRIWVVDANGVVIKTHRVSGRLYEPYAGTYRVYSRSLYAYSAHNPSIRWRFMVRFAYGPGGGRIGMHEIPTQYGVPLQSTSQLGLPLSGGCVRQSTADAIWMWNWAGLGTVVVVL